MPRLQGLPCLGRPPIITITPLVMIDKAPLWAVVLVSAVETVSDLAEGSPALRLAFCNMTSKCRTS